MASPRLVFYRVLNALDGGDVRFVDRTFRMLLEQSRFSRGLELVLELTHRHTLARESHAFALEAEALFERTVAAKRDPSARSHDPVPGQVNRALQRAHRDTGATRNACRFGDRAIARYLAARDLPDDGPDRQDCCVFSHAYVNLKEFAPSALHVPIV